VVWDSVDCISHLFEQASSQSRSWFGRFVTRFELPRTRRAEGQLICSFDHTLVTSAADREALLRLSPKGKQPAPLSILPNGVDLDYFHPNPGVERDAEAIVFSGKMSYHANISMAKYLVGEIMPLVWNSRPGAKLFIVGKDPTAEIKELSRNPLVTVTGTVGDIRPYLWRAAVSVVPLLYGAGIQNKILEAMATATPVITTSRTLSALNAAPGREVVVADAPATFAAGLVRIMESEPERAALGQAGLAYVQNHHHWTKIAEKLLEIYENVSSG
jgi:glycosyltransferase involved in cell wall biosynthesis